MSDKFSLKSAIQRTRKYTNDEIDACEEPSFSSGEEAEFAEGGEPESEKTGLSKLNIFSMMVFKSRGFLPFLKNLPGVVAMICFLTAASPALQAKGIFTNSLTFTNGIYAAEGFGSNYYLGARYNHFFNKWTYFVEASIGFSSVKSQVLEDLAAFQVFDSNGLMTYEFLLGYDMKPLGGFPFLVAGVAGINQGGQSKFAYVLGLGKHIPLAQFFNAKRWGLRYDIRDQIFKQQVSDEGSFVAHNLVFTLGLTYYF